MSDDRKRETTVRTPKGIEKAVPSRKGVERAVKPGPVERTDARPVERKG